VHGDDEQLTVLLNNLVENALRYTPPGGAVEVRSDEKDGRPILRVIDTGPGIPDGERGRVFDRFYRGEEAKASARRTRAPGWGSRSSRQSRRRMAPPSRCTPPLKARAWRCAVEFPPHS
jgi:signal transduction histidine kinase